MSRAAQMLDAHPTRLPRTDKRLIVAAVDACLEGGQAATACADGCVADPDVANLTGCLLAAVDCADVCAVTARLLSRQAGPDPEVLRSLLSACARACRVCADACVPLVTDHPYCEVCLLACRHAEQSCLDLLDAQR